MRAGARGRSSKSSQTKAWSAEGECSDSRNPPGIAGCVRDFEHLLVGEDARAYFPGFDRGGGSTDGVVGDVILERIERLIAAFSEGVGPRVQIALDLNYNFRPEGAIKIGRLLTATWPTCTRFTCAPCCQTCASWKSTLTMCRGKRTSSASRRPSRMATSYCRPARAGEQISMRRCSPNTPGSPERLPWHPRRTFCFVHSFTRRFSPSAGSSTAARSILLRACSLPSGADIHLRWSPYRAFSSTSSGGYYPAAIACSNSVRIWSPPPERQSFTRPS